MRALKSALIFSALAVSVAPFSARSVSALPLSPAAGAAELAAWSGPVPPRTEVRNNGGAVAAGIIGGMILGGIIASQPRYYQPPYPYYPAYRSYPVGSAAIAYCARRFKSYDPHSMTYLGYDGFRHSCP
jgi:hypothetical protein